jgi:uncharacterized membrane protein YdcZ (DUF606 family)
MRDKSPLPPNIKATIAASTGTVLVALTAIAKNTSSTDHAHHTLLTWLAIVGGACALVAMVVAGYFLGRSLDTQLRR